MVLSHKTYEFICLKWIPASYQECIEYRHMNTSDTHMYKIIIRRQFYRDKKWAKTKNLDLESKNNYQCIQKLSSSLKVSSFKKKKVGLETI